MTIVERISRNPKTTLTGSIVGLCGMVDLFLPGLSAFCEPIGNVAMILFAYFAMDAK